MNERPSAGSGVVGYGIVLIGIAAFVLSCFLPYTSFQAVVGADSSSSPTFSYYRLVTTTPSGGTLAIRGRTPVSVRRCRDRRMGRARRTPTWPSRAATDAVDPGRRHGGLVVELDRPARQRVGILWGRSGLLVHARQRRCGYRRHDRRLGPWKTRHAGGGGLSRWSPTADGGSSRLDRPARRAEWAPGAPTGPA